MRDSTQWPRVAAVVALGWLTACGLAPTSAGEDLRLETFVSGAEFVAPGDSVVVRVVITNRSRWPRFTSLNNPCDILFEIRDASGSLVPALAGSACLTRRDPPTRLDAGDRVERTMVWRGDRFSQSPLPVPPGTYQILGRELWNGLTSTPVTVQVRAGESRDALSEDSR